MQVSSLVLLILLACLALTGCASQPEQASEEEEYSVGDPWENWNRKTLKFNLWLDRWFLKPLAKGYHYVTPNIVNRGVTNFFNNLSESTNMVNNLLQGKIKNTFVSLGRFLINTTIGVGGLFDVATKIKLEEKSEDFGQTLATWGVPSGPYLMLPFFGPATLRDGLTKIPDWYTDPATYVEPGQDNIGLRLLYYTDQRADLLNLDSLLDANQYTLIREVYLQHRADQLRDGVDDLEGDDDNDEAEETEEDYIDDF